MGKQAGPRHVEFHPVEAEIQHRVVGKYGIM